MHILASHNRSEFLATPALIRFDYARGQNGFEPTLLIKGSTLLLKYIALGVPMQLAFAHIGSRLLYALKIFDDKEKPSVFWSILERDEEKAALMALRHSTKCQTFIFNELALNVAWTILQVSVPQELEAMITQATTGHAEHSALEEAATLIIDRFCGESRSSADLVVVEVTGTTLWNPVFNHFITSHATRSPIDFFDKNEGNQQEQMCIWLTDNLHPHGVHHSPQIPKGRGFRELTDILLSYQFGTTLIESKALAIYARNSLPNRTKLAHDTSAHIEKAVKQLRGSIRQLKKGVPVTSKAGAHLDIERTQPMHGIILIPDLDLIEDRGLYGLSYIQDFMEATGGFLHMLDVAELLRVIQAAEMIAARGKKTTPMMAFDYYLMERANKTLEAKTLCVEVLLRLIDRGEKRIS